MTLNPVAGFYRRTVLDHPAVIIAVLLAILAFFALQARQFARLA